MTPYRIVLADDIACSDWAKKILKGSGIEVVRARCLKLLLSGRNARFITLTIMRISGNRGNPELKKSAELKC